MIDIVMLCQNRPKLTQQAIVSLREHTNVPWRLTIVDDGSGPITESLLSAWQKLDPARISHLRNGTPEGPGPSRNRGIYGAEGKWGRGDLLYLCDNDCYFKPGWAEALTSAFPKAEEFGFKVLAGYVHPYNQTNAIIHTNGDDGVELHEKYAVGLLSWMMRWETWDAHGPLDPAPRANFSEDWAMCHKIRLAGGRVGCVFPWVVVNCGLTGSDGRLSPGSELIYKQDIPEGVVIE